jgi:hypothetical protein
VEVSEGLACAAASCKPKQGKAPPTLFKGKIRCTPQKTQMERIRRRTFEAYLNQVQVMFSSSYKANEHGKKG